MARNSRQLRETLGSRLRTLERSRAEVERLQGSGLLTMRACEHVYEGLFLAAFTAFERFIEDLFIGLMVDKRGVKHSLAAPHKRVLIGTHDIARELAYGAGRSYVDWLPFADKTLKLAKVFFRGGYPFSRLADPADPAAVMVAEELRRALAIRNAIAHRSDFSMAQFQKVVLAGKLLLPSERGPAGFLRGLSHTAPPTTRFEVYSASLAQAARILAG